MDCIVVRFNLFVALLVSSAGHKGTCGQVTTHVSLATFNTGLTPKIAEYAVRRRAIGPRLRTLQADVVCLQEVWFSSDMTHILSSLGQRYPHTYSYLHDSVGAMRHIGSWESPCATVSFVTEFLPCFTTQCAVTSGQDALLTCAIKTCGLMSLEQQCITCLVLSDPGTAVQSCLRDLGTRFNAPGLLLLSDLPILRANITRYLSHRKLLLPRAYITAEIEGLGTVVCTHTTANLGSTYFEVADYRSWAEQNLDEARALVESLAHAQNAIVMGDLNSSPNLRYTGVLADFPEHYWYFRNHGYRAPFVDWLGICTWCTYNPLADARRNHILDHVFLRNHTHTSVMRIFDEHLKGPDVPLSDHFGVKVTVVRID